MYNKYIIKTNKFDEYFAVIAQIFFEVGKFKINYLNACMEFDDDVRNAPTEVTRDYYVVLEKLENRLSFQKPIRNEIESNINCLSSAESKIDYLEKYLSEINEKLEMFASNNKLDPPAICLKACNELRSFIKDKIEENKDVLRLELLKDEKDVPLNLKGIPNFDLASRYLLIENLLPDLIAQIRTLETSERNKHKVIALLFGCSPDTAKHIFNNSYRPLSKMNKESKDDIRDYLEKIGLKSKKGL